MNQIAQWAPGPGWEPIAGAEGAATVGVWRVRSEGRTWIVKRLRPERATEDNPHSFRWWRREIMVAQSGVTAHFEGLKAPAYRVEEDGTGATLWSSEVETTSVPPEIVASALGTFASTQLDDPGWFTAGRLRDRVMAAAGAQSVLERLPLGQEALVLAQGIWERRERALETLDALPQLLSHGDALPRNLLRQDHGTVTAIDWDQLGYAPVGADLASYSMWSPSPAAELVKGYARALAPGIASRDDIQAGVSMTTALIAVLRVIRTASGPQAREYQDRLIRALPELRTALAILQHC